jgi:hypothetical protein
MTDMNVANLLVAALVSAVVALGIEWLAKPRLEARKERVLRRSRASDDVRRHLDAILFSAMMLARIQIPANLSQDQHRSRRQDVQAAADGIVPATRLLEEAFREVMIFTRDRDVDLLASYVGFVRGVMGSDRPWQEQGELLATGTPMIMNVLGGPGQGPFYWIRWRYRARQTDEAKAFIDGGTTSS